MKTVLVLALGEIREGLRNRWVAASIVLLATLAFALSALGSAPTGTVNADALSVSVASLSSLSVYLVPGERGAQRRLHAGRVRGQVVFR